MNKIQKFIEENKLLFGVFVLGILWEVFVFYRLPKQAWVEGLLEAWYTQKGLVFYRDFTNQYPPFLHMLMVVFHKVFGFTQTPSLLLAPLNSILVLVLLLWASLKRLSGWFRILPLVFFLFWDPVLSQNHFSTAAFHETVNFMAFILWFSWYKKPDRLTAFWIGLLSSASLFSMHISVGFVGFIFLSMLYRVFKNKKNFSAFVFASIAFLIPLVFIVLWFAWKNALYDLYWWNIAYYFSGRYPYASLGRGLTNTLTFGAVFGSAAFILRKIYLAFKNSGGKSKDSKELDKWGLLFLFLIVSSLPISIWFAIFHPVRFQIALPIFAFVFGWGIQLMSNLNKEKKFVNFLLILLVVVLNIGSFYFYMLPFYKRSFLYRQERNILSKVYKDDPMYDAVKWIRENTSEDARLFVIADPLFYLETQRLPANPRGTMNQPFTYEPLDELSAELSRKPPDYWVIDERLVNERFLQFGYPHTTLYFDKLLACEPEVAKIEYVTIREHNRNSKLCVD
ncbi:MAG: hypothetical protein Q7S60_00880 [bacterium]|nr:hypothetical protein [bacterium]